jgi:hypothetical protein
MPRAGPTSRYVAIRYTERLVEAEAVSSVRSNGDSQNNALAESVNGLYKAELLNRHGPGDRSQRWSSRPPNGSTSGTPAGFIPATATFHRPSSRPPTIRP